LLKEHREAMKNGTERGGQSPWRRTEKGKGEGSLTVKKRGEETSENEDIKKGGGFLDLKGKEEKADGRGGFPRKRQKREEKKGE